MIKLKMTLTKCNTIIAYFPKGLGKKQAMATQKLAFKGLRKFREVISPLFDARDMKGRPGHRICAVERAQVQGDALSRRVLVHELRARAALARQKAPTHQFKALWREHGKRQRAPQ